MIERFRPHLKGKENVMTLCLLLMIVLGGYWIVAWASYSPLDNAWSVSSSATTAVLNKTGQFGAWSMDMLYVLFGKIAFLVPFFLCFAPLYVLLRKLHRELTWRQLGLGIGSFVLFMLGLSVLAEMLLSASPYYLAGGVVGDMLVSALDPLGIFGTLLIAMVLTATGFYFCSLQSLLPLFTAFYHWITFVPEAQKTENVQKNVTNSPLIEEASSEVSSKEQLADSTMTKFTDPAQFGRPHITGLREREKIADHIEPVAENFAEAFTDITQFKVDTGVVLPKVQMPTENVVTTSTAPEIAPSPELSTPQTRVATSTQETVLPTIRLNPVESTVLSQPSEAENMVQPEPVLPMPSFHISPQTDLSAEVLEEQAMQARLAQEFEAAEQARQQEMALRAKQQGLEQTYQHIINTPEQSVAPMPASTPEVKNVPENTASAYPKGYGSSLIHPLLQRQHQQEKPTTPLPTLDLLSQSEPEAQQITEQEILSTSARLEKELANFGVKAKVEDVLVGPVVTRYEILPAPGVKASKITNLDSDLARALMFRAIRITEVIPGKPYMGIETPNTHRETVWLRDVLDSSAFRHSKATLPMALGKDISGEPVVVDMAKMPHLLVAGQTGGGKSVGVNTMILSLLFKLTPEQVRFIMIDPKVVELSIYNDIPHLLTPVVTDMKKAANALRWAVEEMERRYLLVSHLQVRNIEGYNAKIDQAAEMNLPIPNPIWRPGDSMDPLPPPLTKLSYIVLIVDEFADLMMSAGKQVEEYIMRIAQKARAVGIHLILATQRPSTDVITGVIKANIPSRIAFTVATQIDSRTILDKGGAEALLGRGDMLYSGASSPDIIRVHGAYMTDEDVQRVADNWRARGKPTYLDSIVESAEEENNADGGRDGGELDPLFDEIVAFVVETGVTSISGIQRRFSLGFNRAGRIVDQLEAQGIISEPDSRNKREVLAK